MRDGRGRFLADNVGTGPIQQPKNAASAQSTTRAANGRFVGDGARAGVGGLERDDSRLQVMAKSIVAGLLDASGSNALSVDPTLQAAAEIKDVVAPLGRGVFSAMGERRKDAKRERWYGRILKALTRKRPNDGDQAVIAGGETSGVGGMFNGLMGMLGRFLPAVLTALLPVLAGLGTAALGTWLGGRIYEWLDKSGILTKVFDAFDNVRSFVDDAKKKATTWLSDVASGFREGFSGTPALDASGRAVDDPRRVDAKPKSLPQRIGDVVGSGARIAKDALVKSSEAVVQAVGAVGSGVRRVVGAGRGFTDIEQVDGTMLRRAGTRNWRNNNPGNLEFNKYTKSLGAVGSDGRFAVFPTLKEGRAAQGKLLFEGEQYRGLDLKAAIARYAPPNENDTERYQRSVLASVQGSNRKMSDYSAVEREAILDAMARVEGFKVGKVSSVAVPTIASVPQRVGGTSAATPSMPASPALPPIPKVDLPASVGADKSRPQVVVLREPVTQNVQNRGIAHAVTGGIGK